MENISEHLSWSSGCCTLPQCPNTVGTRKNEGKALQLRGKFFVQRAPDQHNISEHSMLKEFSPCCSILHYIPISPVRLLRTFRLFRPFRLIRLFRLMLNKKEANSKFASFVLCSSGYGAMIWMVCTVAKSVNLSVLKPVQNG